MTVSFIIPTLNEEKALPQVFDMLSKLDTQPKEIIFVDGGSVDTTRDLVRNAGYTLMESPKAGRSVQMNLGASVATGAHLAFVHADNTLPTDFTTLVQDTLKDKNTALAAFICILKGPEKLRWATSAHHFLKTWYMPFFVMPISFWRGCRIVFGDQVLICRRDDFEAVGGYDDTQPIMEEADLCLRMVKGGFGRIRQVPRKVWSHDRRIAEWGFWKANGLFFYIGVRWWLSRRSTQKTAKLYREIR